MNDNQYCPSPPVSPVISIIHYKRERREIYRVYATTGGTGGYRGLIPERPADIHGTPQSTADYVNCPRCRERIRVDRLEVHLRECQPVEAL